MPSLRKDGDIHVRPDQYPPGLAPLSYRGGGRMTLQIEANDGPVAVTTELASGREVEIAGMLFDMDGTLVDSIEAVEGAWRLLAEEYGVPMLPPGLHGLTAAAVIAEFGISAEKHDEAERRLTAIESRDGQRLRALPGITELTDALPLQRWGIVTSAARSVARARFGAAGLPRPTFIITGDDVSNSKPAPEPFLSGLRELRSRAGEGPVIALEDTVAGVTSARAAGCVSIGVLGTVSHDELVEHAHLVIPSARALSVREDGSRLFITVRSLEADAS